MGKLRRTILNQQRIDFCNTEELMKDRLYPKELEGAYKEGF